LRTLGALLALAAAGPEPSPSPVTASALVGELTRVDLARRSVSIKTEGRDAREVEAAVTKQTRMVSRGRDTRLEDLRPGDRVVIMVVEAGSGREARLVKVIARTVVASPSPARPASPGASAPGSHF
jgi:hypothetical protein